MTIPLFPSPDPSPTLRLAEINTAIKEQEDRLDALYAEQRRLADLVREADLRERLADLPPEVREMLRGEEPRAEDMRRLVPRGLAQAYTSGGRFRFTERSWTTLGRDLRRLLLEGA